RRAGAVDGDQKRILATSLVVLVLKAVVQKNTILHGERREVARTHADECEARRRRGDLGDLEAAPLAIDFKQRFLGREKKRLERARSVHHAENLAGGARHEPIAPGLLRLARRDGQVGHLAHLVECDGAITRDRTQHLEPFAPQNRDQILERGLRHVQQFTHTEMPTSNDRRRLSISASHSPTPSPLSAVVLIIRAWELISRTYAVHSSRLKGTCGSKSHLFSTTTCAARNIGGYLSGLSAPSVGLVTTTRSRSPRSNSAGQTRLPTFSMKSRSPSRGSR